MISIIIIALALIFAAGLLVATRKDYEVSDKIYGGTKMSGSWFTKPGIITIIGLLVGFIQPYSLERVDAGNVGIKVNLTGDSRGVSKYEYKVGWVMCNSWSEKLYEFPTFQQHIEYADQTVITKGGFQATIKPTFNYSLKADAVGDMFSALRLDVKAIEQGWLMTAIVGSVNDVANKWEVDAIFNDREKFESAIVTECNKRVAKWFTVSQLRTNIIPPEALKSSIEAKTKAVQEAQAKMQQALVADANAQKMIAEARGDSAQAVISAAGKARAEVIEAEGLAQAMKLKQQQLTPLYVDYLRVQAWDGKYPSTMLGGNSSALFNMK
jgi:hypothetical protein